MTDPALIAIFTLIAGAIGGQYLLWRQHVRECEKQRIDLATAVSEVRGEVSRLFDEVGRSHDTGMRKRLHEIENLLSRVVLRMERE